MSANEAPAPPPGRGNGLVPLEIRVATVMTGGVSLAIWMGGVAAELDRLRRSNPPDRGDDPEANDPGEVAYQNLLRELNCTVDFDVFAGTSAGGINAAVNALAAATGGRTETLRQTWIDVGSLQDLLRSPLEKNPPSLLYGDDKLLAGLLDALPEVRGPGGQASSDDPDDARYPRLAITTTLLKGEVGRFRDDAGTLVQNVDHRGLFTFDRDDLADEGIIGKLALAARSSASFPGAFEASRIPVLKPGEKTDRRHPDMAEYVNSTSSGWAVDGGVLANRPLGPALRWVFERPADTLVRRVLAYVVPTGAEVEQQDAGFDAHPVTDPGIPPGLVQTLLGTVGVMSNQSIAEELEQIQAHNRAVDAQRRARGHLALLLLKQGDDQDQAHQSEGLWEDYLAGRAEREAQELLGGIDRHLFGVLGRLPRSWQAQIREMPSSPRGWHAAAFAGRTSQLPTTGPVTIDDLPAMGLSTLERATAVVLRMTDTLYPDTLTTDADQQRIHDLAALKKATHDAVVQARKAVVDSRGAVDLDSFIFDALPSAKDSAVPEIPDWIRGLAERWPHARPRASDPLGVALRNGWACLGKTLDSLAALRDASGTELTEELTYLGDDRDLRLVRLARLVVCEGVLTPARPAVDQRVELIQMSADTRTHQSVDDRGRSAAKQKLTGLQLNHFGAFYRGSWRANDWMWGRIDGAGWVLRVLLQPTRVRALGQTPAQILDRLSAATGARTQDAGTLVTAELARLLDVETDDQLPDGLPETALWAATAVQRRIAWQELEKVYDLSQDSKAEPATENSGGFRREAAKAFPSGGGQLDDPSEDHLRKVVPGLLAECRVGEETIAQDARSGSRLFIQTASKTLATGSAAAQTVAGQKPPGPLRPVLPVLRGAATTTYVVGMGASSIPQLLAYMVGAGGLAALTGGLSGVGALVHATAVVALGLLLFLFLYIGLSQTRLKAVASVLLALGGVLLFYIAAAPFIPDDWRVGSWQPREGPFQVLDGITAWLRDHAVAWLILVLAILGLAVRPLWQGRDKSKKPA